jgi:hypothetical protein
MAYVMWVHFSGHTSTNTLKRRQLEALNGLVISEVDVVSHLSKSWERDSHQIHVPDKENIVADHLEAWQHDACDPVAHTDVVSHLSKSRAKVQGGEDIIAVHVNVSILIMAYVMWVRFSGHTSTNTLKRRQLEALNGLVISEVDVVSHLSKTWESDSHQLCVPVKVDNVADQLEVWQHDACDPVAHALADVDRVELSTWNIQGNILRKVDGC